MDFFSNSPVSLLLCVEENFDIGQFCAHTVLCCWVSVYLVVLLILTFNTIDKTNKVSLPLYLFPGYVSAEEGG